MNVMRTRSLVLLTLGALLASGVGDKPERSRDSWVRDFGGEKAVTRPNRDSVMGFNFPTRVSEVHVKGGDRVSAGDLLLRADDGVPQALLKLQRRRAANDLEVKAAQNELELATIRFNAVQKIFDQGSGSKDELDEARNIRDGRDLAVAAAKERLEEQTVQLERLEADAAQYRIEAPFDAIVKEVNVDVGQVLQDAQPVLRVVDIARLKIDVPAKTSETMRLGLKMGTPAWVLTFDHEGRPEVYRAKVVEVDPTADAGSDTRRIRIETPNPRSHPSGQAVWVRFVKPSDDWNGFLVSAEEVAGAQR